MGFRVLNPAEIDWTTRPHGPDEPARHVRALSELAGFAEIRANLWRYEPGARGRRHRHPIQEETFLVLSGTLTMYLGDPPERKEIEAGSLVRVDPGTPLQAANHGDRELVVFAVGFPPESETAEFLDGVA